ncbi:hypothetical protein GIW04_28160, partial [Pseudomonas sp. PA-4-8C]|nr:hypothetical protein [Pseudomonas sp. PA-4-8C]
MRLYLCEKPSQAKDIAAVLGASRRGDGCWLGHGVTVTWCIGHWRSLIHIGRGRRRQTSVGVGGCRGRGA